MRWIKKTYWSRKPDPEGGNEALGSSHEAGGTVVVAAGDVGLTAVPPVSWGGGGWGEYYPFVRLYWVLVLPHFPLPSLAFYFNLSSLAVVSCSYVCDITGHVTNNQHE